MKFIYLGPLFAIGMISLGCTHDVPESFTHDSVGPQAHEFEEPYRIFADGKAIDTDIGHAAPFVTDYDGDGLDDLLVGQFGDGILKIYRNIGSKSQPNYAAGVEFMDGTDGEGRIPTA